MEHDFRALMQKKNDSELITILTVRRTDYAEEAIAAAQAEFDKRGIPQPYIEEVKVEQLAIKEEELARANEPLDRDTKILAMVFPLLARAMNAENFRKGGYTRKLAEMGEAYWKGRVLYIGIIIVLIVLAQTCN